MRFNIENLIMDVIRPWFVLRYTIYALLSLGFAVIEINQFSFSTHFLIGSTIIPIIFGSLSIYGATFSKEWRQSEKYINIPFTTFELLAIVFIVYISRSNPVEVVGVLTFSSVMIITNLIYLLYRSGVIRAEDNVEPIPFEPEPYLYIARTEENLLQNEDFLYSD